MARVSTSVVTALSMAAIAGALMCELHAQQEAQPQVSHRINIQLAPVLQSVFNDLLAASPTFRAQSALIMRSAHVRITVMPLRGRINGSGRARSTISHYRSGAITALVEIPVPLTMGEYGELFGHEFEHIVEQIERINLAALVVAQQGARRLYDGAFETARARRVGLAVEDEYERSRETPAAATRMRSSAPLDVPIPGPVVRQ